MSYNKVILLGNLTRDPELKYTQSGTAIMTVGIAVNRRWKNDAGETMEEVTFVDITAFGRTAEAISQYLKKGKPILVEGRLKLDTWEDKQTQQKRSKLGVIIESFQFVSTGEKSDKSADAPRPAATSTRRAPAQDTSGPAPDDDDRIPF